MRTEFTADFLQRYEILELLGEGGAARVYLARQRDLDRICAIKAFTPTYFDEETAMARFLDEGRLLALVTHPNIVQVYDTGMDGRTPFLVLEYIEGRDLKDRITEAARRKHQRALSPRETFEVSAGIARGLAAAHAEGVIHRDLKPENVLLDADGVPRVADFGFAKVRNFERSYRTQQGIILGTPYYIAPEVVNQEEITPRSDLYALGIIMYECLTGRVPFTAESDVAVLVKHATDALPLPSAWVPDLPAKVDDIVLWCTEKKPDHRPESAEVLAQVLADAAAHYPEWVRRRSRRVSVGSRPGHGVSSSNVTMQISTSRVRSALRPLPEPSELRRERLRLLGRVFLGALLVAIPLLGWLMLGPSPPERIQVEPNFDGLVVRWESQRAYRGKISLRKTGTEDWQDITEPEETRTHRVRVTDLGEGEYQIELFYPGGETPCPPTTVRRFRNTRPRLLVAEGEDRYLLSLETTMAVAAAVTAGDPPTPEAWVLPSRHHRLGIILTPDQEWRRPTLFLRDTSGEVRRQRIHFPVLGRNRLAEKLREELEALRINLPDFSNRVQAERKNAVESGAEEVRRLAAVLREGDPDLNEREAHLDAEFAYMGKLDNPFDELYSELPVHNLLLGFRSQARAWFSDSEIPRRERLQLYHELLAILPLDAVAEAEGASAPLAIEETLTSVAETLRPSHFGYREQVATREAQIRQGRGVSILDRPEVRDHTLIFPAADVIREAPGVFALSRAVGHELVGFDLKDAPEVLEAEFELPEASRGRARELAIAGYNLWPHFLIDVSLEPVEGGTPLRLVFRNRHATFPGGVSHPLDPHDRTQLIAIRVAPWALPPGRYRVQLSGRLIPGTYDGLVYQVPKLLATWE